MNIAIIGSGNVGGALAKRLSENNVITLGVRDVLNFKGKELLNYSAHISVKTIKEAVQCSEVIIISVPAQHVVETTKSLGNVAGKIIIDTMNAINIDLKGFNNTTEVILSNCNTTDVVKCFNTTGFENLLNPIYNGESIDNFTAGSSEIGIKVATQLAKELGFKNVYHFGGNDKFNLIEQFAFCWINLAIMQKQGREIAFKLVKR